MLPSARHLAIALAVCSVWFILSGAWLGCFYYRGKNLELVTLIPFTVCQVIVFVLILWVFSEIQQAVNENLCSDPLQKLANIFVIVNAIEIVIYAIIWIMDLLGKINIMFRLLRSRKSKRWMVKAHKLVNEREMKKNEVLVVNSTNDYKEVPPTDSLCSPKSEIMPIARV
jgi:hypothetical protein